LNVSRSERPIGPPREERQQHPRAETSFDVLGG